MSNVMVTPDGKRVRVSDENMEAALAKGLKPASDNTQEQAFEYETPQGKRVYVKESNVPAAEKQGLKLIQGGWRGTVAPLTREPESGPSRVTYGPEGRPLEAVARGFGQGVTLDNLDKLLAGGRALLSQGQWDDLYRQYLEEEKQYGEQLVEENPGMSVGGQVLGYAVPGIGMTKIAKPATRIGRYGIEAGLGALQGYGQAEEGEELGSMAQGALSSVAGMGLLDTAGAGLRSVGRVLGDLVGTTFFSTPKEVTKALRANPKALEGAMREREIANALAGRLQEAKQGLQTMRTTAREKLGPESLAGKQSVVEEIQGLPTEFGVTPVTQEYPGSRAIQNEIDLALRSLGKSGSQADIKDILTRLDEQANFSTADSTQINAVRKRIRGLIDKQLKAENEQYKQAMKPLAKATGDYKAALKESGVVRGPGGELMPAKGTVTRLRTLANQAGKDVAQIPTETLEKVYPGIGEELLKSRLARQAEGGVTQGSRNVNLVTGMITGGGLGATSGDLTTAGGTLLTGAILGGILDKYGRNIGARAAKAGGYTGRFLDKYGDYFKNAANREMTHQFLEAVDPEYNEIFQGMVRENFSNPEQLTDILGSAVLGSDLTRAVGSVGAGLGSLQAGGDFSTGFNERFKEYNENPSQVAGVASMLGAALPTGKLGKVGSGVVRGVRALDELLSDTGRQRSAPNVLRIKLPSGDEFPSKIKSGYDVTKAIDNLDLGGRNKIKVQSEGERFVSGYIDHPDYPKHTRFTFDKDNEGTWALNSNFRSDQFADVPELKGSSTRMRQEVAKAVGGIASDSGNRNTSIGIMSYLKDPESILTRPEIENRGIGEPQSKFYTPGDETQREDFMRALEQSYGEVPNKGKAWSEIEQEIRELVKLQRIARERTERKERLFREGNELRERLLDDPQFAPLREAAGSAKQELIDEYLRILKSGGFDEIQIIRNRLQPSDDLLTKILKTPEGKRDELKQTEIMNQMLRESRPQERFRDKENDAYDRIAQQGSQQEIKWFKKYKDSNFASIPGILADAKTRVDQIFRYYEPWQIEQLKKDQIKEWDRLRERGKEALQERNYRDLRDLGITNMMRDSAVNYEALSEGLWMRKNADSQALNLFDSNLSPEQMIEKMKPYINATQGRVGQTRSYDDIHNLRTLYSGLETNDLKDILADTVDKGAPWYQLLETAVGQRIIKDILKRRGRSDKADTAKQFRGL